MSYVRQDRHPGLLPSTFRTGYPQVNKFSMATLACINFTKVALTVAQQLQRARILFLPQYSHFIR